MDDLERERVESKDARARPDKDLHTSAELKAYSASTNGFMNGKERPVDSEPKSRTRQDELLGTLSKQLVSTSDSSTSALERAALVMACAAIDVFRSQLLLQIKEDEKNGIFEDDENDAPFDEQPEQQQHRDDDEHSQTESMIGITSDHAGLPLAMPVPQISRPALDSPASDSRSWFSEDDNREYQNTPLFGRPRFHIPARSPASR